MPRYSVPLKAGVAERLPYPGKSLQILSTGAAANVSLSVLFAGEQDVEDLGNVSRNDGSIDGEPFTGLVLKSAIDTTVDLLVSRRNVKFQDNAAVSATLVGPLSGGRLPTEAERTRCNITQTVVAITAADQVVLAANAARRYLAFMVVGSVDVTITPDAAAVAGAGMVLQGQGVGKQGGSWTFDGSAPTDAFHAIAAGVGSSLVIWEGV